MKGYRIWFASVLGLTISLLEGWSNAYFVALLPLFMLTTLNRWHTGMFVQLVLGVVWVAVQSSLIIGFLQPYPVLMFFAVGMMLLMKCFAMHHKATYLFGYIGLIVGLIAFNFGGFVGFDLSNFLMGVFLASLMTCVTCALAFYFFPDPPEEPPTQVVNAEQKPPRMMLEQTLLAWVVAMVIFIIFQMMTLNDSLSAQISMVLMLSPMTVVGAVMVAKIRVVGTFYGCLAAMVIQLGLYEWYDNVILFVLAFSIAAAFFCRWLASDSPLKVGIGFSAMSGLTVPLTSSLVPGQQDAVYAILYRFSSIIFAVIVTALLLWLTSKLIERVGWLFRDIEGVADS